MKFETGMFSAVAGLTLIGAVAGVARRRGSSSDGAEGSGDAVLVPGTEHRVAFGDEVGRRWQGEVGLVGDVLSERAHEK